MVASQKQQKSESNKLFQAIGLIYGKVAIGEEQSTVEIDGERFKLTCHYRIRKEIINYLENNADAFLYLKVYPQFNIFTKNFSFTVVNFFEEQPKQTQVNQFLLAGVWQYAELILDTPVMSVYRNKLRPWESKSTFWQNHFPVRGFNKRAYSNLEKDTEEATKRTFYEIIVCFNPKQKEMQFLFLLDSSEKVPQYINRKSRKRKKSSRKHTVELTSMNFITLQKTAAKLRESGFLEGKIAGKGVTKEFLTTKIEDTLSTRPEAKKVLKS